MENEAVIANSKAVKILAAWATTPSQQEVDCVMEDNSVETYVHVLPELKLPKAGGKVTKTEEVHPFWFIKRTDKDESVANMEMVFDDWTQVVASPLKALVKANAKVTPATYTSSVSLPCLVNTVPIMAGEEVILKWKAKPAQ